MIEDSGSRNKCMRAWMRHSIRELRSMEIILLLIRGQMGV